MREEYPTMSGAESFYLKGNSVGLLLSHGFMGTPQSVKYLGEKFFELGYTVYAPRLKGHGTHYKDLENATHLDWFSDLEYGYTLLKETCSSIFILGQSMGGTLALLLATKYKEISGLILINAALRVPGYDQFIGKSHPRYISETTPDIKLKDVQEITYHKVPLQSIFELQTLMKKAPGILKNISNPIICFKSLEDHVVPPEDTDYIIQSIHSPQKEVITLYNSYHVASMDHDKDRIVEETHEYMKKLIGKNTLLT